MTCPYCGEGPVYRALDSANGMPLHICAECDTVWLKTGSTVEITNYSSYSEVLGLPPLWDRLRLLSALTGGEEVP